MIFSLGEQFFASFSAGNELLWFITLIFNFAGILFAYRFFGSMGLYAWLPIAVIIANIQVIKIVELFGLSASLGNIIYATSFLATDILSENHGKRNAIKAVGLGFLSLVVLTLFMNLALLFKPSPADFAQKSMLTLYTFLPRIALASFIAYAVSQLHDVWTYAMMKRHRPGAKWIWLRNNASTMVSQAIDSMVFVSIAFAGVISAMEFWQIAITTYVLKCVVAVADTPLLYIAVWWKLRGKINDK